MENMSRYDRTVRLRAIPLVVLTTAALTGSIARAEDWPNFRGQQRNGISAERGWVSAWPPSGPRKAWSAQLGEGFSSVSVAGGKLYTMGNRSGRDSIYCFDAVTGRPIWHFDYPCQAGDYGGPRCTPTVDGGNVYTLSREGLAICLNANSGRPAWQKNLAQLSGAQFPQWGFAGSPLVLGNTVLYNVGTAGVCLDKNSGKQLWLSGREQAGYSTPVPFGSGAKQGVAFFVGWGIVAVNPATGKPLWQHPWATNYGVNAADPIFAGDTVFISSGYNHGSALIRVGGPKTSVVWENRNIRNHFNSCVLVGGYLYGNDDGTLKCIEMSSGRERWSGERMGKGGLIAADGKLIVLTERGELFIAPASPDRFTKLARAQVLSGSMNWTQPALANGFIYCRSHDGELVCLDVRGRR